MTGFKTLKSFHNLVNKMNKTLTPIYGAQPYFGSSIEDILKDIRSVLNSGNLTHGTFIGQFEEAFSQFTQTKFNLGVSSGGTALELILKAIDIRGKEVIVPTDTFVATANAVLLAGGIPIFADISKDTLSLNPETVSKLINSRTVAVISVHMFGLIAHDFFELKQLCDTNKIHLIEDAAHAHGAAINGQAAGSLGLAAAFSFYPTKVITTGEGGIVSTNDESIYRKILVLRNHGKSLTQPIFEEISNNYRLAEIPSILGLHQTRLLEDNIALRRNIATKYRKSLADHPDITLLPEASAESNVYWRFPFYLSDKIDRIKLQNYLEREFNVRITWMYEPLCHQQPVFVKYSSSTKSSCPTAEWCINRLICLPSHPGMSEEESSRVIEGLLQGLSKEQNFQ